MATEIKVSGYGKDQLGSDDREIFLTKFSGMILDAFAEQYYNSNLTLHIATRGGKAARFNILGRGKHFRLNVGENLLVPDTTSAGVNGARLQVFAETYRDVPLDKQAITAAFTIDKLDKIMAEDSTQEQEGRAQDMARQIKDAAELEWMSTIAHNIMSVDNLKSAHGAALFNDELVDSTNTNWTRRKAVAAYAAGLTDSAPATSTTVGGKTYKGNSFGYHIDTLASADAVRNMFFLAKRYFTHMRVPQAGRFAIIGTDYATLLLQRAGMYTGTTGPIVEFNSDIAGGGQGNLGTNGLPKFAGFTLYETPLLTGTQGTGLGTEIDSTLLKTSGTPTGTDELRYAPNVTPASVPMLQWANMSQTIVEHGILGAGTQPNAWAEWRALFDSIGIMFGHYSMIGTNVGIELETEMKYVMEVGNKGWLFRSDYFVGNAPLRPEVGLMIRTAHLTTA